MINSGLSEVISDILTEKSSIKTLSRGQTDDAKETILLESWAALNTWIESRICKRRGADVPMLGAFTWEIKFSGDGRQYSRPMFMMSDAFMKNHKVKRQRIHKSPDIVKAEEINYSKLAIKYTKSLSKDMVFNGTRDIIRKIGDKVEKSLEFEIEFTFGTLKSRERKVRFEFNQTRLMQLLPENLRIGTMPQEDPVYDPSETEKMSTTSAGGTNAYDETSMSMLSNNDNNNNNTGEFGSSLQMSSARASSAPEVPDLNLNTIQLPPIENGSVSPKTVTINSPTTSSVREEVEEVEKVDEVSATTFNRDAHGDIIPIQDRMLSPRLVELMAQMDESLNAPRVDKVELRKRAQERVEAQAYLRCLDNQIGEAEFEEKVESEAQSQLQEWEGRTREKVQSFHDKKVTMKGWLDDQIAVNRAKYEEYKKMKATFQPSFFLPENAGNVLMPSGSLPGGPTKKDIKDGLKKDLKYQIDFNARKGAIEKARKLEEERDYLDHVAMEIDLEAISEKATHLEKQQALLESWERDAHIRNLKKLQTAGTNSLKDYIYVNMPDADKAADTLKNSGFAVGYDTRKGGKW
jgi:hypothetical protein